MLCITFLYCFLTNSMWVRDFRLHAEIMGKCKETNDLQQFSFARRIPEREDAIQCVFHRKIIC